MKMNRYLLLLIVFLLCATSALSQIRRKQPRSMPSQKSSSTQTIKIGLLDNSRGQYLEGCGCSFWTGGENPKNDKYILLGNYDKQAWMNIDGEVVQLRLVKDTTKYQGKKGDRYYQTYQSSNLTVKVECVATGFGDTHAVFCNSNITVAKGTRKQTVKTTGSCGC